MKIACSTIFTLMFANFLIIGGGAVASGEAPRVEIQYDSIGNRVGRTVQHGDQKVHYDRMGRRTGTTVQKSTREVHYDQMGRRTGQTLKKE